MWNFEGEREIKEMGNRKKYWGEVEGFWVDMCGCARGAILNVRRLGYKRKEGPRESEWEKG